MRSTFLLFILFVVLQGLTDWYIYRRYVSSWTRRWMHWLYWTPSYLFLIGMIWVFLTFEPQPQAMNRFSLFLGAFLCFSVPKALFALVAAQLKVLTKKINRKVYETHAGLVIGLSSFGSILFGITQGKELFQLEEVTIQSEKIPIGFEGYRIIQISDIHAGSWTGNPEGLQKAVDIINAQHPDLILFTGDMVNNLASELDEFIPVLSQIKAKDGIYSILGNHDYSPYIKWESKEAQQANLMSLIQKQEDMGWKMLNNSNAIIHHNGDSIAILGVENSGKPPFPDYGDLPAAIKGTEGMYQILMSHDPSHWRREILPKSDIPLTLAGHTHGMQLKILGFCPARFAYPEYEGLYTEGDQQLYVNIGLGFLLYPMRLGAWPEITLFTLSSKQ